MYRVKIMQGYSQEFRCAKCAHTFNNQKDGLTIRIITKDKGDVLLGICNECHKKGDICIERTFDESEQVVSPIFHLA